MKSHLVAFANAVRDFQTWSVDKSGSKLDNAFDGLRHLLTLTLLVLPLMPLPDVSDEPEPSLPVDDDEWKSVYRAAAKLPVGYYSEIFNPLIVPPEEGVIGDLGEDIADIYRDVVEGLRLFDAGHLDNAHWHWIFGFMSHWGEHASSAIRTLQCQISRK